MLATSRDIGGTWESFILVDVVFERRGNGMGMWSLKEEGAVWGCGL